MKVGIAGRSGSGKSTLARLLVGLLPPTSGEILYDGRSLSGLDLPTLRRQIGFVPQNPYIFGSSLRQNIALTFPDLPLAEIEHAAQTRTSITNRRLPARIRHARGGRRRLALWGPMPAPGAGTRARGPPRDSGSR
jgi:ABC-type transport system involved in cytochrome bd biosynthesis fused ATPase/permease subunit